MKKIKILLIVLTLLLVTGCNTGKSKEVKSMNDFYNIATEKEFVVSDNMANYTVDYIKEAMIATVDGISLEMITYDSEDNAIKIQNEHIKSFTNRKSANARIKKEKGKNYYKYSMISNGYYLVSNRVENTLIFTTTVLENKDKVDSVLDELGY